MLPFANFPSPPANQITRCSSRQSDWHNGGKTRRRNAHRCRRAIRQVCLRRPVRPPGVEISAPVLLREHRHGNILHQPPRSRPAEPADELRETTRCSFGIFPRAKWSSISRWRTKRLHQIRAGREEFSDQRGRGLDWGPSDEFDRWATPKSAHAYLMAAVAARLHFRFPRIRPPDPQQDFFVGVEVS